MFRVGIKFENVTFWRLKFVKIRTTEYVVYGRLVSHGALEEFGVF